MSSAPKHPPRWRLLLWSCGLIAAAVVMVALAVAIRDARRSAVASAAQGRLNQLQLALHNYHEVHGRFPPAYLADADGTPMHSWRMLILPYIEEQPLYEAYDFGEPWNGPNNSKLADRMPGAFGMPGEMDSSMFTNVVAVTGPGTAFPGATSTRLSDFSDGPESTILLTEIADSQTPWLEPRDVDVRNGLPGGHVPGALTMSSAPWRRPYVVFADQIRAYAVHAAMPTDALRALTTIAGNEPVTRAEMIRQGLLK